MVYFDFSCKHDILIKNPDGSLLPMDEPFFESEEIAPKTWKIPKPHLPKWRRSNACAGGPSRF